MQNELIISGMSHLHSNELLGLKEKKKDRRLRAFTFKTCEKKLA